MSTQAIREGFPDTAVVVLSAHVQVERATALLASGERSGFAASGQLGGAVMGIGTTMLEETVLDPETGRIVNATFGDYLIPVNADLADVDVVFVGTPDTVRPFGIKGIGEIGVVGVSAAIANAVYPATGRRVRSLPITIEQLLQREADASAGEAAEMARLDTQRRAGTGLALTVDAHRRRVDGCRELL